MKVVLAIEEGPGGTERFEFDGHDTFIVGRSRKNTHSQLRGDPYISRHHFILELSPPRCFLKDLGSTNGTKVNGRLIEKGELRELSPGDTINVGRTMLRLTLEGDAPGGMSLQGERAAEAHLPEAPDDDREESATLLQAEPAAFTGAEAPAPSALHCSRCGREIEPPVKPENLPDSIFLCEHCIPPGEPAKSGRSEGDYELYSLLGRGGMGEVFKARNSRTGMLVAFKRLTSFSSINDETLRRFTREMHVMRELVHPNIVRFIGHGQGKEGHYLVMEYASRGNISDLIEKELLGPLPYPRACRLICQALEGLQFAHCKGFIHRDIKPQNLLLHGSGSDTAAKISDFGLAKNFQEAGGSMMTKEGEVAGTILFMAPEQLTNYRFVKPPADVYSMGMSLYYLLSGKYPFAFPSPLDLIRNTPPEGPRTDPILLVLSEEPAPIEKHCPALPPALAAVVNKSICKDEMKRFASAEELRTALLMVF
ncbi:MAG: protein kinase [Candidatus Eremiobacteraeota bacterium]|nr:protein kinase [Candidatus Eremiobacteraeota bacterium]